MRHTSLDGYNWCGIGRQIDKLVRRIKNQVVSVSCKGVGCHLLLSEERQKGEKMTISLVRALGFHVCVRLKDDYKSQCGQ